MNSSTLSQSLMEKKDVQVSSMHKQYLETLLPRGRQLQQLVVAWNQPHTANQLSHTAGVVLEANATPIHFVLKNSIPLR
jgi:hypothetical protein